MIKEKDIEEKLKNKLNEGRFYHSIGVRDTAVKMAKIYNGDVEKAKIAGLVHDCGKNLSDEEILTIIKGKGYKADEIYYLNPNLLHGLAGAVIANEEFKIEDKEILTAVACHTTGKENMTLLEKIIYISDYIEPLRDFQGVENLREAAFSDIDKALYLCLNNTIEYVLKRDQILILDTIKARNYLLMEKQNKINRRKLWEK